MIKQLFKVYCVSLCGKHYRVKVGHLDEFAALHLDQLEVEQITVYGYVSDSSINYAHPYEWYRKI